MDKYKRFIIYDQDTEKELVRIDEGELLDIIMSRDDVELLNNVTEKIN